MSKKVGYIGLIIIVAIGVLFLLYGIGSDFFGDEAEEPDQQQELPLAGSEQGSESAGDDEEPIEEPGEPSAEPSAPVEELIAYDYIGIFPNDANTLIEDNPDSIVIVDVSNRYEIGHIPGAVNYIYSDGSFEDQIGSWDKNDIYLIYSDRDVVSSQAAELLGSSGFPNVYYLKGSYGLWLQWGYDSEK